MTTMSYGKDHSKLGVEPSEKLLDDTGRRREFDLEAIRKILDHAEKLPILDTRSSDDILGYNEFGLFDEEGDFSLTDIKIASLNGH